MKAALYCRLSEEDKNRGEADSVSIQNQKSMLVSYAEAHGWEIYAIYSDDDYAGADRRRPAFNRLIADAEARRFDIVLCKTQSRFTREMELVEKYIHGLFPQWGIRFVSIVDNADTAVPGNKKARQISGLVNEWYLEDMSENIRAVLTDRRRHGLHIGSHALYGYRKDPEQRGHLIPNPVSAAVVREIFALYAAGYGKTAIARQLNARAVPTPADYRAGRSGALWQYSTIGAILTNEMYIGNMVQGRYGSASYKTKKNRPRSRDSWITVSGTHAPIVEEELWQAVQDRLRNRTRPFTGGKIGALAGLVVCAHCGETMRTVKNRGRRYFQCRTRYLSPDRCPGAFVSAAWLMEEVRAAFTDFAARFADCLTVDALADCLDDDRETAPQAEADNLLLKIEEYKRAAAELYMDKVRGTITETEYAEMRASIRLAREQCEKAYERLLSESADGTNERTSAERLTEYLTPDTVSRPLAQCLISSIAVSHRTDDGAIPVTIRWRF